MGPPGGPRGSWSAPASGRPGPAYVGRKASAPIGTPAVSGAFPLGFARPAARVRPRFRARRALRTWFSEPRNARCIIGVAQFECQGEAEIEGEVGTMQTR